MPPEGDIDRFIRRLEMGMTKLSRHLFALSPPPLHENQRHVTRNSASVVHKSQAALRLVSI